MEPIIQILSNTPFLWIEDYSIWVQCLPVSKIQFEEFICSQPDHKFDENWYYEILQLNGRTSTRSISKLEYWKLFITGIFPNEAQEFIEWFGENVRLPTIEEWINIFLYLDQQPAYPGLFSNKVTGRMATILNRFDEFLSEKPASTLADQLLMSGGIVEWAKDNEKWVGIGQPNSQFYISLALNPRKKLYEIPLAPNKKRMRAYGIRLIKVG